MFQNFLFLLHFFSTNFHLIKKVFEKYFVQKYFSTFFIFPLSLVNYYLLEQSIDRKLFKDKLAAFEIFNFAISGIFSYFVSS